MRQYLIVQTWARWASVRFTGFIINNHVNAHHTVRRMSGVHVRVQGCWHEHSLESHSCLLSDLCLLTKYMM